MFPNIMPFSVEATLTLALMLAKSWGARVRGEGFSTNLRSPVGWIHLVKRIHSEMWETKCDWLGSAIIEKRTYTLCPVRWKRNQTNLKWPAQGCNSGAYHWFGWPPGHPTRCHTGWHERRLQHTLGLRSLSAGSPRTDKNGLHLIINYNMNWMQIFPHSD